jgi:arylsulfatase A-like enzyme
MKAPNILILICDQLNASVLGCSGGPVSTPNLDRLADAGVRFTNAVCPTPFCSPSRASMSLGLYPHTHGITYNVNRRDYPAIPAPDTEQGIRADEATTEKLLHEAGYDTHHYGKWHLMDEDLSYYADMYGEHHEYAQEMQECFAEIRRWPRETWMNWYGWALPVERSTAYQAACDALGDRWRDRGFSEFITKIGRLDLSVAQCFDARVADRTVAALQRLDERPFMITCSFNLPHDPNVVPSPYYDMFNPETIRLPDNVEAIEERYIGQWSRRVVVDLGEVGLREFMRVYYASVKLIDDQVGRVLDALEATGRAKDTIVLFTADHGDMCGEHGMVWKSTDAFYDGVVRIPLLVRYPRQVHAGELDIACNLVDVMPTLLDLVGHPIPAHVEGSSLAPYLRGERPPEEAPPYSFCARLRPDPAHRRVVAPDRPGQWMVRGRGWKYCRYEDGDEFLYPLAEDPGETQNLALDPNHDESKATLGQELDRFREAHPGS